MLYSYLGGGDQFYPKQRVAITGITFAHDGRDEYRELDNKRRPEFVGRNNMRVLSTREGCYSNPRLWQML